MAKDRSFTDYVARRFYNQLFEAVKNHLNPGAIITRSQQVRRVDSVWLSDISVKRVLTEDQPGTRISFDVLVEADYEISEWDRRYDRYSEEADWFKVSCTADLAQNLNDFRVTGTEVYYSRGKQHDPLSDALVPIIRKEQLDDVAKDFLSRYYSEALKGHVAVNPYTLAERMGLTVEEKNLTSDGSIFGQIYFYDCEAEHYCATTGELESVAVKAGTIFVDPANFFFRNLGSTYNTIVHECVHWHLHRKSFELERLYNVEATQIQCQVAGGIKPGISRSATDWMEWQANALAPKILMPSEATKIKAAEFMREYLKQRGTDHQIDVMEQVIEGVAIHFGVSKQSAKIRLYELGYEVAAGTFIYLDGRYVKPHTWKEGALKANQTFSISFKDALIASIINPDLRAVREQGLLIYVDSHFCINDPKYIFYDVFGNPQLTDYARYHMDECCLIFELAPEGLVNAYQKENYLECVLCRDINSGILFTANFADLSLNQSNLEKAKAMQKYNREISKVLRELPQLFPEALVYLMNFLEVTVDSLAEASNLGDRTISRLRGGESKTLENVVAVCIGMKLPPSVSHELVRRAGFFLTNSEKDLAYRFLLDSCYSESIYVCNEMLSGQNIPILGQKT